MNIQTERLSLRPFKNEDFTDTVSIYSNENTCKYLLHDSWNRTNAKNLFNRKLNNQSLEKDKQINLACIREGKVIGDISIWCTTITETVEIGFVFNDQVKGKGFAYEAALGVIKYLFFKEKIHRVQACLDAQNQSSSKLCERLGMRKEGVLIKAFFRKNTWVDTIIYGMIEEDLKLILQTD